MIYPSDFEQKLGFDQIRLKLKSYCQSNSGAEWVDRVTFSANPDFIRVLLKQNLEFRQILEKGENFPSRHFFDADEWLAKISLAGNWLEGSGPEQIELVTVDWLRQMCGLPETGGGPSA